MARNASLILWSTNGMLIQMEKLYQKVKNLNSQTVGMAVARPYGFEIDFGRNFIFKSAAWFFVIILEFILTSIFEIKIHEKIP